MEKRMINYEELITLKLLKDMVKDSKDIKVEESNEIEVIEFKQAA